MPAPDRLASTSARVVAWTLDRGLSTVAWIAALTILGSTTPAGTTTPEFVVWAIPGALALLQAGLLVSTGATLGKRAVGVCVADEAGVPAQWLRLLARGTATSAVRVAFWIGLARAGDGLGTLLPGVSDDDPGAYHAPSDAERDAAAWHLKSGFGLAVASVVLLFVDGIPMGDRGRAGHDHLFRTWVVDAASPRSAGDQAL